MCKALGKRVTSRWNLVSYRGKKGGEWRGIVDILAIRKDTSEPLKKGLKRGDLFQILIVQIKGGKAKLPSPSDILRLKLVAKYYHAKNVVLYEWSRGKKSQFKIWDGTWKPVEPTEIFG